MIFIVSDTKIGLFPNFQQLKCDLSNIKIQISIRAIVRAVWRMSETFKSNTINLKKNLYSSFMILIESFCKFLGCFPKASQDWKVAPNLMSPIDVICFKFPCGSGVAKPVVSYSKVKLFSCCLQNIMAGCCILGRRYFGHNLQI